MSVSCSLVVVCWERVDLLALLYVMFPSVFVTFPYGVLGQVQYLIVSIPYIGILPYFDRYQNHSMKDETNGDLEGGDQYII